MIKNPEFDDIRPYYDDEVAPVIERLLENPQFQHVMNSFFPDEKAKQVEQLLRSFTSQHDFQHLLMKELVFEVLNQTSSKFSWTGLENVSQGVAYTYISNHRDIVLDAAILSSFLGKSGYDTIEIAIGDNLLLADWIRDLVRLNRSFIVKRNVSIHHILEVSKHLSKYIHYTVKDKKRSIWIAQREGRAKDSNDRTQESVIKMLAMGSEKKLPESLAELDIMPVTFSYEYDPCDFLKAKEFQQKRDNPDFTKTQKDDLLNMKTGLLGYKGRVHLQFGRLINSSLLKLDNSLRKNELALQVASLVDNEIFLNYKFYPINYIAYDRLWGNNFFQEKYTPEDVENFDRHFRKQLDKIDLPEKDIPYLIEKMQEMYAYPVKNFLSASTK